MHRYVWKYDTIDPSALGTRQLQTSESEILSEHSLDKIGLESGIALCELTVVGRGLQIRL